MTEQLSLEEIQREEERLLARFHEFCTAHDLRYFLAYGSLLGAVRGGGPIPWDDDIDVAMPRPDYDRFVRLYRPDEASDTRVMQPGEPNYPCYWAKLVSLRTHFDEPGVRYPTDYGVFLDVFPLDGLPSRNPGLHLFRVTWLHRLFQASYGFDWSRVATKSRTDRIKQLLGIVGRALPRKHYLQALEREVRRYPYNSADTVAVLFTNLPVQREALPKSSLEKTSECRYGDLSVTTFASPEQVLARVYGSDWRTPIKREHDSHGTAVWR